MEKALPPTGTWSSSSSGLCCCLHPPHPIPQALCKQSLYICFCWTLGSINLKKLFCLVYFSVLTQVLVPLQLVFALHLPWHGQLWEARVAGQGSGKRNATGKILDKNREGRKMKSVPKYERGKVDRKFGKTVEWLLGSVLKNMSQTLPLVIIQQTQTIFTDPQILRNFHLAFICPNILHHSLQLQMSQVSLTAGRLTVTDQQNPVLCSSFYTHYSECLG